MRIANYAVVQRQAWADGGPTVHEPSNYTTPYTPYDVGPPAYLAKPSQVSLDLVVQANPGEYAAKVKWLDGRFTVSCFWHRYWLPTSADALMRVYAVLAVLAAHAGGQVAVKVRALSVVVGDDADQLIHELIDAGLLVEDDRIPGEWRGRGDDTPRRFTVVPLPGDVLAGIALDSGGWPDGREGVANTGELDEDGSVFGAAFAEAIEDES